MALVFSIVHHRDTKGTEKFFVPIEKNFVYFVPLWCAFWEITDRRS